jgi:hypothetical protein
MADATVTFTIDTASSPWIKVDGTRTTVSGIGQTFAMRLIDLGSDGLLIGGGVAGTPTVDNDVTLADGTKLRFSMDKKMTTIGPFADGVAKNNAGSLWVSEDDSIEHEVKVTSITMTDADAPGANNLASISFEYPGKPWSWTWVNINSA